MLDTVSEEVRMIDYPDPRFGAMRASRHLDDPSWIDDRKPGIDEVRDIAGHDDLAMKASPHDLSKIVR